VSEENIHRAVSSGGGDPDTVIHVSIYEPPTVAINQPSVVSDLAYNQGYIKVVVKRVEIVS
jgi:hypothetical protein